MKPFNPRALGKMLGFLKIANAIDPNIKLDLKGAQPPAAYTKDVDGRKTIQAAQADAKYLQKNITPNLKSLQRAGQPMMHTKIRLGDIGVPKKLKLGNYDPDVEYWEDFNEQFGDGPGNASHNEETQPPSLAEEEDPKKEYDVYGVNSNTGPDISQLWGKLEGRGKDTARDT